MKSELRDFVSCIPSAVCQGLCWRWDECCPAREPVQGPDWCWGTLQLFCEGIKLQEEAEMQRPPMPPQSGCLVVRVFTLNLTAGNGSFCETQPLGEV